ncbi:MAG: preprotein translocase subunit SecA [Acinetobacter sp.]|nr:preprotein translocase subunit SecA [Acinetobacter sp.]
MSHAPSLESSQQPKTLAWRIFLIYDIFMMILIFINLSCLVIDGILMSDFAVWFAHLIHVPVALIDYKAIIHPWVDVTEHWFTLLLIVELFVRWGVAIYQKHHPRWFFFPFVHWYEVLAIIPILRFLRLFRAAIIAYRLHEMGFHIIPKNTYKKAEFYYFLILEELTRRIALTGISAIERELKNSSTLKHIIHDMLNQHRHLFAETLSELLQKSLATALLQQQRQMSHNVGQIVNKAIEDTPELHQLLRLLPVIGSRLEHQIQSIGQRLGENITHSLVQPFVEHSEEIANDTYQLIAEKASQTELDTPRLNALVQSVVFESLEIVRKQVKTKKWEEMIKVKVNPKDH